MNIVKQTNFEICKNSQMEDVAKTQNIERGKHTHFRYIYSVDKQMSVYRLLNVY